MIAVIHTFNVSSREDLSREFELLFVEFYFPNSLKKLFTLGVFYRPLYNDLNPVEDLYLALQNLSTLELVPLDDFNLREFD